MDSDGFFHDKLISGKVIAEKREGKLREEIAKLDQPINVVSILVGDNPASVLYTELKQKKAAAVGIEFRAIRFAATTPFEQVVETIEQFNNDDSITGIMIQLPLPAEFLGERSAEELTELIDPKKDIDGLTSKRLVQPAVVQAVLTILEHEYITVFDMPVAILGNSDLVGKPLAEELSKIGGKVTVIDETTEDPAEITKAAPLIISAVGKHGVLTAEMVNEGAVVIDIGTMVITDEQNGSKKTVGDVDFAGVLPKVKRITPVPGGVGPVTIVSLMENCVELCRANLRVSESASQ